MIDGDSAANTLDGTADGDTLNGLAGNDVLRGLAGDDQLNGGDDNDRLIGGLGNDVLDGGSQTTGNGDTADYSGATGAVTVNLGAGTATGADGNDTLTSIEQVYGSAFDDQLTGGGAAEYEYFRGNGGNDTIDGGSGFDIADYGNAPSAVVLSLVTGSATGGDGSDTLVSIEGLSGSAHDDTITGGSANDWLRGRAGNDTIDGGAGNDRAVYDTAGASVSVDLMTGTTSGAEGTDTLISIEDVRGSGFDDTLTGNDGANSIEARNGNDSVYGNGGNDTLRGEGGNDMLDGGSGDDVLTGGAGDDNLIGGTQTSFDYADYGASSGGVAVNLTTGSGGGGDQGNDTYTGIEGAYGSAHDDTLTGDDGQNLFRGNGGNDVINGGGGNDIVDYVTANGSVTVNLATQTGGGANAGSDTFTSIEYAFGGAHADVLTGNDQNNLLRGRGGNDTIDGGAGIDRADYRSAQGAVTVTLNDDGSGSSSGADGEDTLISIENLRGSESFGDKLTGNASANNLVGMGGDDELDGMGGIDTASFGLARADATLARQDGGWTVTSTTEGADTLRNIERLAFTDTSLALDLEGNAGSTAQIVRALFGGATLQNKAVIGIGLALFDGGMSYADVVGLAVETPDFQALIGGTNGGFVDWVYQNVVGAAPSAADRDAFVGLLDSGASTQASLAVLASQHALNAGSAELAGLADTGLAFTPFGA